MFGNFTEKVLRIGVAFSFFYPAVSAWFNPYAWVGYFPGFMLDMAGQHDMLMLHIFGITELLIGLWLVFGKRIFIPSVLASVYLFAIVVLNLNQMDVIFRDVSILCMSVALMFLYFPKKEKIEMSEVHPETQDTL